MTDTIEFTVKQGHDYMSPRRRALYCQFQTGEILEALAQDLLSGTPPGPDRSRHAAILTKYVKDEIDYANSGLFPQGTDHMLGDSGQGDCVDQSVLLMSLFEAADLPARYCCYKNSADEYGHCVVEFRVTDTELTISAVDDALRDPFDLDRSVPMAWDVDETGRWILFDPTTPFPPGFDRGSNYEVTTQGIDWSNRTNVVCFRPIR